MPHAGVDGERGTPPDLLGRANLNVDAVNLSNNQGVYSHVNDRELPIPRRVFFRIKITISNLKEILAPSTQGWVELRYTRYTSSELIESKSLFSAKIATQDPNLTVAETFSAMVETDLPIGNSEPTSAEVEPVLPIDKVAPTFELLLRDQNEQPLVMQVNGSNAPILVGPDHYLERIVQAGESI